MGYPITEIQGLGADIADILKKGGIRTTVALLRSAQTPNQRLALAERIGVAQGELLDWVTAADRMRIKGVGADYCELLRIAGVRTVNELRFRNAEKLAKTMRDANIKRKLVAIEPSSRMVTRWIENAKGLPTLIRY